MTSLPNPHEHVDWRSYARALTSALRAESQVKPDVPTPILLPHLASSGPLARAVTDGLVMFDPVEQVIEFSSEGKWVRLPVHTGYALANIGTPPVAGAGITTTWQKLVAFDTIGPTLQNVEVNLTDHTFTPLVSGAWRFDLSLQLTHNAVASTERYLGVRLASAGGPGNYVSLGLTGRSDVHTSAIVMLAGNLSAGVPFWIEVSDLTGNNYTTVNWIEQNILFTLLEATE